MARTMRKKLEIENANIFWRDFTGRKSKFESHIPTFGVSLNDPESTYYYGGQQVSAEELVKELEKDKWKVTNKPPREEGDDPLCGLYVTVAFGKAKDPDIKKYTRHGSVVVTADTAGTIDADEIEAVDVVINPYRPDGAKHTSAYLDSMYLRVPDERFRDKWESSIADDVEEIPF